MSMLMRIILAAKKGRIGKVTDFLFIEILENVKKHDEGSTFPRPVKFNYGLMI